MKSGWSRAASGHHSGQTKGCRALSQAFLPALLTCVGTTWWGCHEIQTIRLGESCAGSRTPDKLCKVGRWKEVINVPTKGCLWGWQWWAAPGCVWSLQKLPDTSWDTGRSEAGYSEYSLRFIIYKVLSQPWKCWDSQKSCRNVLIKEHNVNVNWESSPGGSSPGGANLPVPTPPLQTG